jgi:hypothetical protein
MALPSGVYTIENVKYHNWAMLLDGNNEGEVVAGSSFTENVGEKVRLYANVKSIVTLNQNPPVEHQTATERDLYSTK